MGYLRLILAVLSVSVAISARADVLLPLDSFRSQGATDHCWAYTGSHLIEARVQARTGDSVVLDTERDLRFGVLYHRFFQRYKNRGPLIDGLDGGLADSNLLTELGYVAEFVSSFLAFGHPVHRSSHASTAASYPAPPGNFASQIGFIPYHRPARPPVAATSLIQALQEARDDSEASRMIIEALIRSDAAPTTLSTELYGRRISVGQVPVEIMPDAMTALADPLVLVVLPDREPVNTWGSYFGGKYLMLSATPEQMELFAKRALDRGIPVIEESWEHAWTVVGYQGDQFAKADSLKGRIEWSRGIGRKLGIEVPKSVIDEMLPEALKLAHGQKAAPTLNRRVRLKR